MCYTWSVKRIGESTMARPVNLEPLPEHPAVSRTIEFRRMYGHHGPCATVTCPLCGKARWYPTGTLRQLLKEHQNFTGVCKPCWSMIPKVRKFRSSRNPSGRRVTSKGYVALSVNAIALDDIDMFDAMKMSASYVFEHRWAMAKHLGRPLTSDELVDHKDGNKENNAIDNLRIYVRGKQEPGSAPGYGTYYHEWQMALLRIRELEALLNYS
jgi:HNH endonuclease